MAIPAGRRER